VDCVNCENLRERIQHLQDINDMYRKNIANLEASNYHWRRIAFSKVEQGLDTYDTSKIDAGEIGCMAMDGVLAS